MSTLLEKKAEFTINLILNAACDLSNTLDINDLSFKKVAEHTGISQRTMFRYFRTRDDFLEALAVRLHEKLNVPDMPDDIDGLIEYVSALFHKLDEQPRRVIVLLSTDLLPKVVNTSAKVRLNTIQELLKIRYPELAESIITKTAANLRYVISASSWRYYRVHYQFDLSTSIECVQLMISEALKSIEITHQALALKP
jgi:AcrR family transcriptional regulator